MNSINNLVISYGEATAVISTYLISGPTQRAADPTRPVQFEIGICGVRFINISDLHFYNFKTMYRVEGVGTQFPLLGSRVTFDAAAFLEGKFIGSSNGRVHINNKDYQKARRQYEGQSVFFDVGVLQLQSSSNRLNLAAIVPGLEYATQEEIHALRKTKKPSKTAKTAQAPIQDPPQPRKRADPRSTFSKSPATPAPQSVNNWAGTVPQHSNAQSDAPPPPPPMVKRGGAQGGTPHPRAIQFPATPKNEEGEEPIIHLPPPVQQPSMDSPLSQSSITDEKINGIEIIADTKNVVHDDVPGTAYSSYVASPFYPLVSDKDQVYPAYYFTPTQLSGEYGFPHLDYMQSKLIEVESFPSEDIYFVNSRLTSMHIAKGFTVTGPVWENGDYLFALLA